MSIRSFIFRFLVFLTLISCIDPLPMRFKQTDPVLVIDGMISNKPGPYTVRISLANSSLTNFQYMKAADIALVEICDDLQRCEKLNQIQDGVYQTSNTLGEVGRSYRLKVRTAKGDEYESYPERLLPPGNLDDVRHQFSDSPNYGFEVFADATLPHSDSTSFVKFDWQGIYEVRAFPSKKTKPRLTAGGEVLVRLPNPPPCSGLEFIIKDDDPLDTALIRRTPCICCTCWIEDKPIIPVLAESTYQTESKFSGVLVARVSANPRTMYARYVLKVVSQSLSRRAYNFWNAIKQQKLGVSDLFQPPTGYIPGNIFSTTNRGEKVLGIFYAASASDTVTIIFDREMVPVKLIPIDTVTEDCRKGFNNSTNQRPFGW